MLNTFNTITKVLPMNGIEDYYSINIFGDVHRFARSCDVDRWKYFLSKGRAKVEERPDRTLFLGLGDYDDFASTREKTRMADLHETTIDSLDEMNEKRMRAMASEMKFMMGRTLGLIEGNHHWLYQDGTTSTMSLAKRLQAEYLGWLCHYTLIFKFEDRNSTSAVHLVLCHGKAGGKTFGITLNQVGDLKQIFPAADIYIMGHDHQRGAWPVSVLVPSQKKVGGSSIYSLKQKRQLLCRSGSFKKAYEPNGKGYEVSRLLRPADLGALELLVKFHRDYKEGDRIVTDLHAII